MELARLDIRFSGRDPRGQFLYRPNSIGDVGVIRQVFREECYSIQHWFQGRKFHEYLKSATASRPGLIVDAGANIGASSVYFGEIYEGCHVFAMEPSAANFSLLRENTSCYRNIDRFKGALSGWDETLSLQDPGLSDWGFRTCQTSQNLSSPAECVQAVSMETILAKASFAIPMIAKLDIEGAEERVFRGCTKWLDRFPLVIIELHDWMLPFSGVSKGFLTAISRRNVDILHRGENMFIFNQTLLVGDR